MSGIYIHIPFCIKKCDYCNFYSDTDLSLKDTFIVALEKEMELRCNYLKQAPIQTLYFGGGTPSLFSAADIDRIIDKLSRYFSFAEQCEITLEANPNSLTEDYLRSLKRTSVNRLSIGIQSFSDDDLHILGRKHTAKQAEECMYLAQKYGFTNLSVDLIYGFPGLNLEKWKHTLEKIKDIPHLSCYQLSLEHKTPLYRHIQDGSYQALSEEEIMQQYEYLIDFAKKHDFIHYETSNFCKKGCESRHNSSYWKAEPYIGLGPGAHSFDGQSRQWNVPDVNTYISFYEKVDSEQHSLSQGENILFEKEILTPDMRYNE